MMAEEGTGVFADMGIGFSSLCWTKAFRFLFYMIFLCCLFFSFFLCKITVFLIRLPDMDNGIYFLEPVKDGDEIVLKYRHSVEKTLIKGVFRISFNSSMVNSFGSSFFKAKAEPSLQAKETWMTSVGTGLPNTFFHRTRQEGKWLVVDEGLREIKNFRFFISTVNETSISTPSGNLDLMSLPSGTIILIDVEKINLMGYSGYLLRHCFI